jgi:hypothetical protein
MTDVFLPVIVVVAIVPWGYVVRTYLTLPGRVRYGVR